MRPRAPATITGIKLFDEKFICEKFSSLYENFLVTGICLYPQ
tara:strand:+ start:8020 stop:8145 length:126 start_codon:yes stop_codon:yes gene_type:complete